MALGQSIQQNTVGLSIFAIVTAGLIAVTQLQTETRIERNERAAKSRALYEIMPRESHDNILLEDTLTIEDKSLLGTSAAGEAYLAMRAGKVIGVILPTLASDGYTGDIRSIVGIDRDGRITGVRVLTHQETPGLGDKIELKKSPWILQFDGKSLGEPSATQWKVKKDDGAFDQLTGATITPRAVVNSVRRALEYFAAHREELLGYRPLDAPIAAQREDQAQEQSDATDP